MSGQGRRGHVVRKRGFRVCELEGSQTAAAVESMFVFY